MGREEEEGRGVREKSVSPWVQQNKSSPPKQNVNECVSERLTPSHHDTIYPVLYCCSPGNLSSPCPSYKFKLKLKLLLISDPWSIYDFIFNLFFFLSSLFVFFSTFLNIIVTNILLYVIVDINIC